MISTLKANWNAPSHVYAITTKRFPGVSHAPYDGLNLGLHVNDESHLVEQNRLLLEQSLHLPSAPLWLNQTHSTHCIDVTNFKEPNADASYSNQPGRVLAILTADCLPVLFTSLDGNEIAAAHAGWRGLVNGVLENVLKNFKTPASNVIAWCGPSISQAHFEVGQDVYKVFTAKNPSCHEAFVPHKSKWLANLPLLAQIELYRLGIKQVTCSGECTYAQESDYYSYRRTPQTGRMATLLWTTPINQR